jgi:bacterioferritin-associated ferredoxin
MIVCACRGVRCSSVKAAIAAGARTVDCVGNACGAGTDCGSCRFMIEDMIDDAQASETVRVDPRGRTHLSLSINAPALTAIYSQLLPVICYSHSST